MTEQHGSYYVPAHSAWPIIGAIGLFFIAFGSLNFGSSWGSVAFAIGAVVLIFMLIGWFRSVISESRKGLYSHQMDMTFRWGMFWFLFCDLFFFATLLGALGYVRWASLPWMAGQGTGGSLMTHYILWPNFQDVWPLIKTPAPYLFTGIKQMPFASGIPALNTLILLISSIVSVIALWACKKQQRLMPVAGLLVALLLGILFLVLQSHYYTYVITQYGLTIGSGIYGSLFFFLTGFHALHVFIGLLILCVMLVRCAIGHFSTGNYFGIEAAVWFWSLITVAWLFIFVFLFGF